MPVFPRPAGAVHRSEGAALEKCGHRAGTGSHQAQVSSRGHDGMRPCPSPLQRHSKQLRTAVRVCSRAAERGGVDGGGAGGTGSRGRRRPGDGRTCCPPSPSTPRSRPPTPASPPRPVPDFLANSRVFLANSTLAFGAKRCA